MASKSRRPKGSDNLFLLNAAIYGLDTTKGFVSIEPVKTVLGLASGLLAMIRVCSAQSTMMSL